MNERDKKKVSNPPGETIGVNRRNFVSGVAGLVGATAAASAVASTSSSAQCEDNSVCRTPGCDYDVVVVGGGFAGITAARDLRKSGLKVLLIEARNRLGGRTFTTDFEGTPIELGGTWVHSSQPFAWAEVQRYGLPVMETPGAVAEDFRVIMPDGKLLQLSASQAEEVALGWQLYCAKGRELLPRPYDLLLNHDAILAADKIGAIEHLNSLELSPLQRVFNETLLSLIISNQAQEMAYLEALRFHQLAGGYFPTFMDATMRFQLDGGTQGLVEAIVEDGGFEVRLSTVARNITETADKVVIETTRRETINCGAVVCTAPMNTIGSIEFNPPLPQGVIEAGEIGHPGRGLKIYAKVKGDLGVFSAMSSHLPFNFAMTYKRSKDHTLVVAFANPDDNFDPYDEAVVQQALRHYIPGAEVISVMHYDWNMDPYSRGTWATYRTGWIGSYMDQFQQDRDRVFFASGDHGEGWRGTIDGAIGAGSIAARKVTDRLSQGGL